MNFLEKLSCIAENQPELIAIVDENGNRQTSYRQLETLVNRIASKLQKYNYPKESFILLRMGRCAEFIAAYYGIIKAGMAVISTLPEYPEERISYIMNDCNARMILDESFLEDMGEETVFSNLPSDSMIAGMNYTSGSTGNPKGVVYTMGCIDRNIQRCSLLYKGLDHIVNASSAPMAFAAFCQESMTPIYMGGTVHILSEEARKDVRLLTEYYEKHHIISGCINPAMLKMFTHTTGLKRVFATGQAVQNIYSKEHETFCVYGLTEAFAAVSFFVIDKKYINTPIGKPFGDVQIEILDAYANPVSDGSEGELYITGYFAEGYHHMPKETEENFLKLEDGRTRFRTHDLGCRDKNGNILLKGRADWMVKINGQRVEIFEVEAVLNQIESIRDGVIKSFVDEDGKTYLCAYYTTKDITLDRESIEKELQKKLPSYMVPSYIVELDEIPRTASGKYDRKVLRAPEISELQNKYEAPANELERKMCDNSARILYLNRCGRNDDLILLGMDSIKIMKLINALNESELHVDDIIKYRTPARICEAILLRSTGSTNKKTLSQKQSYRLLPYQEHYRNYSRLFPGIVLGNTPLLFDMEKGKIDSDKLVEAIYKVFSSHPSLSTVLTEEKGAIKQKFDSSLIVKPEIIKLTQKEFDEYKKNLVEAFDLNKPPYYRCNIYITEERLYLFMDMHHIIADKESEDLIIRDIFNTYSENDIPTDYYVSWLDSFDDACPPLSLTKDEDRNYDIHPDFDTESVDSCESARIRFEVSPEIYQTFMKQNQLGIKEIMIAAILKAQAEYNHHSCQKMAWIYNGRNSVNMQNMAGLFMDNALVKADMDLCSDDRILFEQILKCEEDYFRTDSFRSNMSEKRPIYDDMTTLNYFPYNSEQENEIWNQFGKMESMITNHNSSTNVFYVIVEEQPGHSLKIDFKYNTAVYKKESMERMKNLMLQSIKEICKYEEH